MDANTFWIVVPSLLIALLGWIVASARRAKMATVRAEVQKALIEKLAVHGGVDALLNSDAGKQLFSDPGLGEPLHERIFQSIQTGVILTTAGVSLAVCSRLEPRLPLSIGVLVTGIGVGFLLAAGVTRYFAIRWSIDKSNAGR